MLRTVHHIMPHHSLEEILDSSLDGQVLYYRHLEQVRVPLGQGVRAVRLVSQSGAVVFRQVLRYLVPLLVDVAPVKDIHLQLTNNAQDEEVIRNNWHLRDESRKIQHQKLGLKI